MTSETTIFISEEDYILSDEKHIIDTTAPWGSKNDNIRLKTIKNEFINYPMQDGTWISFRESYAAFAPKPEEFLELRKKIFRILGKKSTPEFDDKLDYLITFLRHQAYINATSVSITDRREELTRFATLTKKIIEFMDKDTFNDVRDDLCYEISNEVHKDNSDDAVYSLYKNAHKVTRMCKSVNESLKGHINDFTPNTMRQILAEELARELEKMGEPPAKYRDGSYFKILRATLEMIPCTISNQPIKIKVPDDLFKIASDAIDEYPNKEPYFLLDFD